MSPLSFISPSSCLSLFFSLSFAGLSPTFSFSLLLPFCAFQICGHDNKSKLNTLDNANTETISAFRYRLYRLFSLPHNTLVAMWLPAKITSSCHTCMLIELFYIGMPVVRTDRARAITDWNSVPTGSCGSVYLDVVVLGFCEVFKYIRDVWVVQ